MTHYCNLKNELAAIFEVYYTSVNYQDDSNDISKAIREPNRSNLIFLSELLQFHVNKTARIINACSEDFFYRNFRISLPVDNIEIK